MIRARANVFKVLSLTTMTAPLVGEVFTYAFTGSFSPACAASFVLASINGLALLWYRFTDDVGRAFRWSSWASFAVFAYGLFYSGGVRSEHYDYVYFFILSNGFYFGARALAGAAVTVLAVTGVLGALGHYGYVADLPHGLDTVTYHLLASHLFVAWLAWQFDRARREAELRLREALADASRTRDQLNAMFDNSPAMHFTKDPDGRFIQVNQTFERNTGLSRAQIIGRRGTDLFPGPLAEKFDANDREVLTTGANTTHLDLVGEPPHRRWHTATLFPVRDEAGLITGTGGIILDSHDAIVVANENRAIKSALDETALVFTVDAAGNFVSVNANFCRLVGYAENELIGRAAWPDLAAHGAAGDLFAAIARAAASRTSWSGEVRDFARDGREFNLVMVSTPLNGADCTKDHSIIICFDISAEIQGETRYHSLIETMDEGVVLWNLAGECVQHNQAAVTILRLTEGELTGREPRRRPREIVYEDGTVMSPSAYPASVALITNQPVLNHVMGFKDFEGTTRWIRTNARPVLFHGTMVAVCTFTDITEQKEIVRRLTDNSDELRSLFQAMTEGVYLIGMDGCIKMVNRAASQILGYTESEMIGASAHALFHHSHEDGRHFPHGECHLYRSLRTGRIANHPVDCFWSKTGLKIPVATTSVPVESAGVVTGALVTFRDLSELRRLEGLVKLEQAKSFQNAKLASLGEMSAGIAHEINNPLAIITGSLEMLTRYRESNEKFDAKLSSITKATGRISKIVKGLQKFARTSSGSEQKSEPLSEIVVDSVVMTETRSLRQGVSVRIPNLVEAHVMCDVVEIEQVLINLINNAIDAASASATPEPWVDVSTHLEGAVVVLRVVDSGSGISAEVEEKLFQPFFTTKPVGQGTGLGLSITKGILEQHGATIALNRSLPHTCFEVRFNLTGVRSHGA